MPIQYPLGAVEEHRLTRRSLGFFDIDHMGQVSVSGKGAGEALSGLVSSRILDMKPWEARYALLLNEAGGVIDDLFIYREEGEDAWFVVVNAGNRETDVEYLGSRLPPGVTLRDISEETYMISLQGKRAVELMDRVSGGLVSPMPRFSMRWGEIAGISLRIGRTGYTGEDGVELFYDAAKARELWEYLFVQAAEAGIEAGAVGLAARDSLRFEAGMPLHGHEISPSISPLEGGLSWACDFGKDFVGKNALLAQKAAGLKRKLSTINVTGGVPREGYPVLNDEGTEIGRCVSGMFCPSTGTYSANALLPPEYAGIGARVLVLIREKPKEGVVVKRPLYIPVYRSKQ
jgi:glycine cleavage system T protein